MSGKKYEVDEEKSGQILRTNEKGQRKKSEKQKHRKQKMFRNKKRNRENRKCSGTKRIHPKYGTGIRHRKTMMVK